MSLVRQSAYAALSAILMSGSRLVFTAILARRLSQEGFGQFVYSQWLVDTAFLICSLGATGAASRYVAEFRSDASNLAGFIRRWQFSAVALPVIGGLAVLVGARISGYTFDAITSMALAMWGVASGIAAMYMATLTGFQRFDLVFRTNLASAVILLTGALIMPMDGSDPANMFGFMALSSGIAAIPGFLLVRRHRHGGVPVLASGQWRNIRCYALNMWVVALLWSLLWSRGELPIVKSILGDAGVAAYVAVLTLFGGAVQGVMLGVAAVAPQLTRMWGEGRKEAAVALARSVMDVQLLVCGFGACVLVFLGPELLNLAFGAKYRSDFGTLAVLSLGLISMGLANQNHLLQIATDGRFSRNTLLVGLVVLMGLAFTLTGVFGTVGAATARATTMLFLAALTVREVVRRWGGVAISMPNLGLILGITVLSILCLWLIGTVDNLLIRLGMTVVGMLLLTVGIRDADGRLKGPAVAAGLFRRLMFTFSK